VVTRTYVNTPKALEDVTETPEGQTEPVTTKGLKSQWIAQNKASANSQLASTDWMVIRKAERDVAIPSDVVTERAKIIADCTAKEAAIIAATTMEEFLAVVAPVYIGEPE
jgi:3-polyprenyl-4-hydroxybenzoate decarboxylase